MSSFTVYGSGAMSGNKYVWLQILRSCSSRFISLRQSLSAAAPLGAVTVVTAEDTTSEELALPEPLEVAVMEVITASAEEEAERLLRLAALLGAAGSSRITTSSVLESKLHRYCR